MLAAAIGAVGLFLQRFEHVRVGRLAFVLGLRGEPRPQIVGDLQRGGRRHGNTKVIPLIGPVNGPSKPSRMLALNERGEDRMAVWIALLRGVNVVGSGRLPMAELTSILGKLRCSDVRTYSQSGNVVLRHAKATPAELTKRIGEAISKSHGFHTKVLVL